jgi:hypothetical protein
VRNGSTGNQDVQHFALALALAIELGDGLDRLPTLLDRIPDQPHAAELARDEDAWNGGFEAGTQNGDVDAAGLAADREGDRVGRARRGNGRGRCSASG